MRAIRQWLHPTSQLPMPTLSPPDPLLEVHVAASLGFLRALLCTRPMPERAAIAAAREVGRAACVAGHSLEWMVDAVVDRVLNAAPDDVRGPSTPPALVAELLEAATHAYRATEARSLAPRAG